MYKRFDHVWGDLVNLGYLWSIFEDLETLGDLEAQRFLELNGYLAVCKELQGSVIGGVALGS